ncbi:hypothetical protein L7F22_013633 [Adiantum nelumboides]|nr:hypothetical protein [Adiantum nelumboides]
MRKLVGMQLDESKSVAEHLSLFTSILSQLQDSGLPPFDDKLKAIFLLMTLPDFWETLVVSLSNNPNLTFDGVRGSILNEEIRRKASGEGGSSANMVRGRTKKKNAYAQRSKSKSKERGNASKGKDNLHPANATATATTTATAHLRDRCTGMDQPVAVGNECPYETPPKWKATIRQRTQDSTLTPESMRTGKLSRVKMTMYEKVQVMIKVELSLLRGDIEKEMYANVESYKKAMYANMRKELDKEMLGKCDEMYTSWPKCKGRKK